MINHTNEYLLKEECLSIALAEIRDTNYENFCPRVWDNILCWPPTPPNATVELPCINTTIITAKGTARRFCQANSTWFTNGIAMAEETGKGWTNYTECILQRTTSTTPMPQLTVDWIPTIRIMSDIGYSISLVILAISFSILISLRRLRCPRNILHLHLFASFMLKAAFVLINTQLELKETTAISRAKHGQKTTTNVNVRQGFWWCKLLVVIWQYFILANYSWILMEGMYLHNLIFMALFNDSSSVTLYIVLGWGVPLLLAIVWAILKIFLENYYCWTVNENKWIFWLCIRSPVALSICLNFFFFLRVTRVLLVKLRSSTNPDSMIYRKLAKSTLVLVPLFGVNYFALWGLSTSSNVSVELAWLFLDQVFASFQGFFVALLYCLMNGEVLQELKRLYTERRNNFSLPSESFPLNSTKIFRKSNSGERLKFTKQKDSPGYKSVPQQDSILKSRFHNSEQECIENNHSESEIVNENSPLNAFPENKKISNNHLGKNGTDPEIVMGGIEFETMHDILPNKNCIQENGSPEQDFQLLKTDAVFGNPITDSNEAEITVHLNNA